MTKRTNQFKQGGLIIGSSQSLPNHQTAQLS
jgi:hypothetical protein